MICLGLQSCESKTEQKKAISNDVKKDSIQGTITVIQPQSGSRKIPKNWKSLSHIQQNWIEVKKDKEGYLIYDPCDGYTRTISLKKGKLHIQWQMDAEEILTINKFTRTDNNTGLYIDVYPANNMEIAVVSAKIIDSENGLVLWEVNDKKWLMTPIENSEKFRHIKHCPGYPRVELEFEEPNY